MDKTKTIQEIKQKYADDLLQTVKEFTERYVRLQASASMEVLTAGGTLMDVMQLGHISNQVMSSVGK